MSPWGRSDLKGVERVERVSSSPALADLRSRLQAVATNQTLGAVFPNRAAEVDAIQKLLGVRG